MKRAKNCVESEAFSVKMELKCLKAGINQSSRENVDADQIGTLLLRLLGAENMVSAQYECSHRTKGKETCSGCRTMKCCCKHRVSISRSSAVWFTLSS